MDQHQFVAKQFEANRTHLRSVAYRMLGSMSDAEDGVQETWLRRWQVPSDDMDEQSTLKRSSEPVSLKQFHESAGDDWRIVGDGACAYFRTGSFAAGAQLVQAISELADLADRQPDVDIHNAGVTVRLITVTDDFYGMTQRDIDMTRQISGVARRLGTVADPTVLQNVQLAIDALQHADVKPFWRAVLGYVDRGDSPEDLVDPRGRGPSIWFQRMDAPRPQRNRIHLDVWVPYEQGEARVAAALAAGGRLVTDMYAPSWWVLADAEGNEACVATTLGRD